MSISNTPTVFSIIDFDAFLSFFVKKWITDRASMLPSSAPSSSAAQQQPRLDCFVPISQHDLTELVYSINLLQQGRDVSFIFIWLPLAILLALLCCISIYIYLCCISITHLSLAAFLPFPKRQLSSHLDSSFFHKITHICCLLFCKILKKYISSLTNLCLHWTTITSLKNSNLIVIRSILLKQPFSECLMTSW